MDEYLYNVDPVNDVVISQLIDFEQQGAEDGYGCESGRCERAVWHDHSVLHEPG